MNAIPKLAIAVSCFFSIPRLPMLDRISSEFASLAESVHAYLVTNTSEAAEKEAIRSVVENKGFTFSLHTPKLLGHPFLLPWSHLELFRGLLIKDETISHFLYLEDDMLTTRENVEYWLQGREELRRHGVYPSFMRYETRRGDPERYMTDFVTQVPFEDVSKIFVREDYCYINTTYPYQAMYLFDRELMGEHLRSPSSCPDYMPWPARASASQGLTFINVPEGFTARNLAGFDMKTFAPDPRCLVHHVANNYVDAPGTKFGKIPLSRLVV